MLWRKIKQSNKKEYWGVECVYCGQGRLLWQWGAWAEPPGSEDEPFGNLGKEYARQRAKEGQRTWGAGALGYSKASTHPSGCRECLWSRLRLSLSDLPLAKKSESHLLLGQPHPMNWEMKEEKCPLPEFRTYLEGRREWSTTASPRAGRGWGWKGTRSQVHMSPGFRRFMVMSLRDTSQHDRKFSPVMSSHWCSVTEKTEGCIQLGLGNT